MSAAAAYFVDETALDVRAPLANTGLTTKRALDLINANCAEFRQAGAKRKIVEVSGGCSNFLVVHAAICFTDFGSRHFARQRLCVAYIQNARSI